MNLIAVAKPATDLGKHLTLTFSSLDWHGCSEKGLIQTGFLLWKFWIQSQFLALMRTLCHYLNVQICSKKASEGVDSGDFPGAAGLTVPLEVGECILCFPEASSALNSEAKPRISQSGFAVWLSGGRNGHGQRWGAGRTRCILALVWVRYQRNLFCNDLGKMLFPSSL